MNKRIIAILVGVLCCFCGLFFSSSDVSAAAYSSWQDCINRSGGRGAISSVSWACSELYGGNGYDAIMNPSPQCPQGCGGDRNACTLWIGSTSDSVHAGSTVFLDSSTGNGNINFYGMCTIRANDARGMSVEGDNGAIVGPANFTRSGTWGTPTWQTTTFDVEKFIKDVTPYDCYNGGNLYNCYERTVLVKRCNSNSSSCSGQYQSMKVGVRRYTLTAVAIEGSTEIQNPLTSSTASIYNGSATVNAGTISGYTFESCWKYNKTDTTCTAGTGSSYTKSGMTANATVYAVYKRKRTLTAYARNTGGTLLQSDPICSDSVDYNAKASCSKTNIANYNFEGWSTSPSGSNVSSTDATYTVNNLTTDTTVYAVYTIQKKTLTAISCDTSGSSIASKPGLKNVSKPVDYNTKASVTRGTNPGYTFIGWRNVSTCWVAKDTANYTKTKSDDSETYVSGSATPAETFNVEHLQVDGTVVAMYQIQQRTLTGVAVDESGTTISAISNVTATVDYGQKASIERRNATGYTFKGWKKKATDSTYTGGTDGTYSVNSLTDNTTVYAVYVRNKFSGQASVAEGTNWNGTTNRAVTGYYPHASGSKTSTSIDINCKNAGCQANFWLQLKRDAGTGSTNYRIKSSTNGVSSAWLPASPSALTASSFPDSGSTLLVLGASNNVGEQIGLVPGGSFCRYITFKPYGNYANDTYETVFACANAKVTNFEGLSKVKSSTSTGWTSTTKSVRHVIQNCSPTDGCSVTLQHALRRSNSIGSTDYNVKRTSNLWDSTKSLGVQSKDSIGSGTFNDGDANGKVVVSDTVKLYPGMVVCETLKFKPNNNQVTVAADVATTVCVSAKGDGQPEDPPHDPGDPSNPENPRDNNGDAESGAFINIEVKNNNNPKYSTYRKLVYAKPYDVVTFRAIYNPTLQYTYYLKPEKMKIDGSPTNGIANDGDLQLGTLFNSIQGIYGRRPWNNAFSIISTNFTTSGLDYKYTNGLTDRQRETNDHKVDIREVGEDILYETASTKPATKVFPLTTPGQITFTDDGKNIGDVLTADRSDTAEVRVPYNFNTDVNITTPENEVAYSGEKKSIGYDIDIQKKNNNVTGDGTSNTAYATIVEQAKVRVITYTTTSIPKVGSPSWGNAGSDFCSGYFSGTENCGIATALDDEEFNKEGLLEGKTTPSTSIFNVPDLDAGTKICVAVAFYPSSSGSDTNLSAVGSGTWRVSDSKCYLIAKKPNFQLWGGGMFMNGGADIPVSEKNNLFGYNNYSQTVDNDYYIFGSWVETSLIAGGTVTGLASGAGTAYTANNSGNLFADPGGSKETSISYCKRSTLSFANDYCSSSYVGNIGGQASLAASLATKVNIVTRLFPDMEKNTTATEINLDADYTESDSGVRYTYSGNAFAINGGTIGVGVTHVLRSDGDITINGDLIYGDGYTNLEEIPKLVIYGNNISIACGVNRVDAVLIADETVDTCPTTNEVGPEVGVNARANSNPLRINGMIIANTLKLNRTYGAGKGKASIIPAEVINYDTTLYLWSMVGSPSVSGSAKYSETYLHELSPRY